MCNGKEEACASPGRRCPSSDAAYRSAWRKARAAADRSTVTVAPATGSGPSFDTSDLADVSARRLLARQISAALATSTSDVDAGVPEAVQHHLVGRYGGVEHAVRALGEAVAARGEELAGLTGAQVATDTAARFGPARARLAVVNAEISELYRTRREEHGGSDGYLTDELRAARSALAGAADHGSDDWQAHMAEHDRAVETARTAWLETSGTNAAMALEQERATLDWARSDHDELSRAQLLALGTGYRDALAELRDMGGEVTWHQSTTRPARSVFDAPTQLFPTDWLDRSAAAGPMVARLAKARAHYRSGHVETVRRRVHSSVNWFVADAAAAARVRAEYEDSPAHEVAPTVIRQDGQDVLLVHQFEVADASEHPADGPPPRGRGWDTWQHPTGARPDRWRRPVHEMQLVTSEAVPQIRSYPLRRRDPHDRSSTPYSTAVHEWQHRFESVVPGILSLERRFMDRRTVDDDVTEIYPGSGEYGYRDDFNEHYMGKVYGGKYFEVMSTGSEALFCGRDGGLVGAHGDGTGRHADEDMRSFVLGVYASVDRSDADLLDVAATLDEASAQRLALTRSALDLEPLTATPVPA